MLKPSISLFESSGKRLIALALSAVLIFTWFQLTGATRLDFQDNKEFYASLAEKLKEGKKVLVKTPFTRYSDLPPRLQSVFPSQSSRFQDDARIPLRLSASRLVAIYSFSILGLGGLGAVAGGLVAAVTGNDPTAGAAVGGGIGVTMGIGTGAFIHIIESHGYRISFFKVRFGSFALIECTPTP